MQTDTLIRSLVEDLRPVRRLAAPARRCARWALGAGVFMLASTVLSGLRADIEVQVANPAFVLKGAALLLVFGLAATCAFQLSVPDDRRSPAALWTTPLALALWVALLVLLGPGGLDGSEALVLGGWRCIVRIAGLGALPAWACMAMLRRAAPLGRRRSGMLACLAAFSLAALGTQLLCARDGWLHVLSWHALPVLLLGLAGGWLGQSMLERRPCPPSEPSCSTPMA